MMAPTKVHFSLEERVNVFAKKRKEWVLLITLDEEVWAITTWSNKPTEEVIKQFEKTVMRSFEVYHRHLKILPFQLKKI